MAPGLTWTDRPWALANACASTMAGRSSATPSPTAPNASPALIGRFAVDVVNPDTVFGSRSDTFEVAINPARFDINTTDDNTRLRIDGKDTVWLARLFGSQEDLSTLRWRLTHGLRDGSTPLDLAGLAEHLATRLSDGRPGR